MRALTLLLTLAFLSACETTIPITQITLRIQSVPEIIDREDSTLRIERRTLRNGQWAKPSHDELKFTQISKWPVDVPVTASDSVDESEDVELIVRALDPSGEPFAEVRVITSFVRRKAKLLEVFLLSCGGVCENKRDCHGAGCDTCQRVCSDCGEVECRPAENLSGADLSDFMPNAAIDRFDASAIASVSDAETDADEADGGEEDADVVVDPVDAAEAGETDAVTVGDADAVSDSSMDAEAMSPDVGGESDADAAKTMSETVCDGGDAVCIGAGEKDVQRCVAGKPVVDYCEHTCMNGRCVDCKPNDRRCDPANVYAPQRCNADGYWRRDAAEAPLGECVGRCQNGICSGCRNEREMRCKPGEENMSQECIGNEWSDSRACPNFCRSGGCIIPLSCTASPLCVDNVSCCNAINVPGGDFLRSYDGVTAPEALYPATVGTFKLDRFEVTVARFRRWLDSFPHSTPTPGAGKNPLNPSDTGWQQTWDAALGTDASKLAANLACDAMATWTPGSAANDNKPINCVNWYMAQAFCIWDGGRLPTEAEWNYAAAGGDEQRVYPWSTPPSLAEISSDEAVFGSQPIEAVGSRRKGDGRWGHADLAGNVAEWVQDELQEPYADTNCKNCADITMEECRVFRGGASGFGSFAATASFRECLHPTLRRGRVGFRCARN